MTGSEASPSFRLAYVPGVTPAKWVRIWRERQPDVPLELVQSANAETPDLLRRAEADAGLLRLPCDRDGLSAIPLYTETTVVVVPKDHLVAAVEEVSLADLADEVLFHPLDDVFDWEQPPGRPAIERPATTADAIELVAAGVGLLVVPQSLARLHHRKDLTYRPVVDAPQSRVALSWPEERTTDLVEDFIGIVRGRTVNSSRGRRPEPAAGRRDGAQSGGKGQDKPRGGRGGSATGGSRGAKGSGRSSGGAKGTGGGRRGTAGRPGGGGRGKPRGRG
ncbi:LysR family transcriptional regulator substrate-binding protein [Streptomyces lichenis]|uniref:LysR family transcriptional regulator substrate-binding protein n=1 Tax=Streptomyces lichenis TaxID=2306967 RepID=A0ABT0I9V6_9ACTN|nr:LysR family transcriptional regulator substrate-binding protein [Streptomyces lichenis]MCK8678112.1 LysR family transcriptional regulator substrate-binding protein [Streptomyces lichenis]